MKLKRQPDEGNSPPAQSAEEIGSVLSIHAFSKLKGV
jgi:hypothetical protein